MPAALEKELAARASDVTEVTLGRNMLGFAAKFMDGKDKDQAAVKQLIQGLDGIYVRNYEFDKEGQYSMDDIESCARPSRLPSGRRLCTRARQRRGDHRRHGEAGERRAARHVHSSAEPKELTIVLILAPSAWISWAC